LKKKIKNSDNGQNLRFDRSFIIHYDWWAFPDKGSSCYGNDYKLYRENIMTLRNNNSFIQALRINAKLVCLAWGWDLKKNLSNNLQFMMIRLTINNLKTF
jgi:hypothetical protein